jgi:signal peptidase I
MLIPRRFVSRLPAAWRRALDWLLTIAAAVAVVLVFEAEVAKPYRIPSPSMEPTLHCATPVDGCEARFSDRVLALKIVYRFRDPRRGEIAVFHAPAAAERCGEPGGNVFVKRVVGLPGETISEREGVVLIDGRPLRERYIPVHERDHRTSNWPRLGPGDYFVMGDNRVSSCDSRTWGPVPRESFIGPASVTYWPPDRISVR